MIRHRPRRAPRGFALIDVLIGGVLLAIGLTAILALGARALNLQQRGEREVVAAALLDEILSTVLTEGPDDYIELHQLTGTCDAPFSDFDYAVEIDDGSAGVPARVLVRIHHESGMEWMCETLIAIKLGDEPDPPRDPSEPIDREGRYLEQEEAENAR